MEKIKKHMGEWPSQYGIFFFRKTSAITMSASLESCKPATSVPLVRVRGKKD